MRAERTALRALSTSDVDAMHALWTDPGVQQHLWDDVCTDRTLAAEVVQRSSTDFAERRCGQWAVYISTSDERIGSRGLRQSVTGDPELLVGLWPRWWGQGLAHEVATAVLRYAFRDLAMKAWRGPPTPPIWRHDDCWGGSG
jgi:ribosomal-protein-alanine N-acetyltransferase